MYTCVLVADYGPLEVDEAHNQDPVSWIFEHMKLVAIIGAAISAAGVVLIVGLSIVDCLVNSSKIAPILDDSGPQVSSQQSRDASQTTYDQLQAVQSLTHSWLTACRQSVVTCTAVLHRVRFISTPSM